MKKLLICIIHVFLLFNFRGIAQVQFLMPLHGEPGKDFFIDYMIDHDTTSDFHDVLCGTKTYNGHRGTDFSLKNFKAMDDGVCVYASTSGKVTAKYDGAFDRRKHWLNGMGYLGGLGNYICVNYQNRFDIYYAHLRKNSITVNIGDSIFAGQPLAKVGSSGYSTGPHLHLEIRANKDTIVDPFTGLCKKVTLGLWNSQPAYDTSKYIIDIGFVSYIPNPDTLKEGCLVKDTFNSFKDEVVCFWSQMHGLKKYDKLRVDWYGPNGGPLETYRYTWPLVSWNDYFWNYLKMPLRKGSWEIKYYINDVFFASRDFYVIEER